MTPLLVITVARKPTGEPSVARNALRWGTGSLNIDGARLGTSPPSVPQPSFNSPTGLIYGFQAGEGRAGMMSDNSKGRWPANLVLQHKAGCQRVGDKTVKTAKTCIASTDTSNKVYGRGRGGHSRGTPVNLGGEFGIETVDDWECEPGCPVAEIDEQSGESESPSTPVTRGESPLFGIGSEGLGVGYGDKGGASRYFKQVGGKPQ